MQKRQEEGGVPQQRGLSSQAGVFEVMGVPPNCPTFDHFTIETHWPWGSPDFKEPPNRENRSNPNHFPQLFGVWNGKFSLEFGGSKGIKPSHFQ